MVIIYLSYLFLLNPIYDEPSELTSNCSALSSENSFSEEFRPHIFLILTSIKLYQQTMSKIQGDVCNFEPSCSRFAYQSIKKYWLQGLLMAADRLERCNYFSWWYAGRIYPVKQIKLRGIKLYDPPHKNVLFGNTE